MTDLEINKNFEIITINQLFNIFITSIKEISQSNNILENILATNKIK